MGMALAASVGKQQRMVEPYTLSRGDEGSGRVHETRPYVRQRYVSCVFHLFSGPLIHSAYASLGSRLGYPVTACPFRNSHIP